MPKRGADEYITKEHGSIANANPADQQSKMSTAAQLARRKIATPKGRLNANRPSSTPLGKAAPQSTFSNPNGGINFGASQSFPQPSSGNNGGFNFQPPQSSTFDFGVPSSAPNPFASVNGTGAGMNTQQQDISMESPQKKPAFGNANAFGANNANSNTSSAFTFGQPPQQQANGPFGFGGSQNGNVPNGGSLFGRVSQPEGSQPPSNPFGQPSQPQPTFGGFGQAASTPQTPAASFTFGQNNNPPAASTSASSFTFGQSTAAAQSNLPSFGGGQANQTKPPTETPKFTFGQSSTNAQGQAPATDFGGAGTNATASSNTFGSGNTANGQAPNTAFGSSMTSGPFSFGQSQTASTQSNPFGGFGAAKPDEPKSATPLFGNSATTPQPAAEHQQRSVSPEKHSAPSSSEATSETPKNPFASLFPAADNPPIAPVSKPSFSFGTSNQAAGSSDTKKDSVASPASKPTFSFGASTQPSNVSEASSGTQSTAAATPSFVFGAPGQMSAATSGEAAPTPAAKASFFFGATTQPATPSVSAAEPKPSERNAPSFFSVGPRPATSESSTDVRSDATAGPPAKEPSDGLVQSRDASNPVAPPAFGFSATSKSVSSGGLFSPAKSTVEGASKQPQGPSSNLFAPKTAADKGGERAETAPAESTSTPSLFGRTSQPESQQPQNAQNSVPGKSASEKPSLFQPTPNRQPQDTVERDGESPSVLEPVKRPVYTKAPPFIPSHLDAERYREYDRNYRLHSLNAGLQRKLENLDPRTHDFDNIIRHYVAARDSIGASLGLYTRNVAGTKRKGDRLDVDDEEPVQNKRTRSDDGQQASLSKPAPFSFGAGSKPQQSGTASSSASNAASKGVGSSNATARLSELIPEANHDSSVDSSGAINQGANFTFSKPPSSTPVPSTTPTKSPPKKPTFEVPKFGGGNANFMNAFGQKAKENAEKFEQSLIEKRKAEDFDSDEDDEETFRKQAEEEMRAKRAKIEAVSKGGFTPKLAGDTTKSPPSVPEAESKSTPKPSFSFGSSFQGTKSPVFSKPGFIGSSATSSFSNPFSALSSGQTTAEQSQQESDEEGDNDDSDHSDGSTKYGNEANDGESSESSDGNGDDDDNAHRQQDNEGFRDNYDDDDDDEDDNDFQSALDRSTRRATAAAGKNAGKSLFDRIEPNPNKKPSTVVNGEKKESGSSTSPILDPAKNSSFPPAVWGSHIGKSTPETPAFSPFTPAKASSETTSKPASTFTFNGSAPNTASTPTPGASIFAGGVTKGGPVPGEGLFGSRPSTPSNAEKNSNLARSILTSPAGTDNTWKEGAPISFANGDKNKSAPTFQFTAPSPGGKESSTPKAFGSLFGTAATGSKASETTNQVGFQFGVPNPNPAPGFLGAISHLGGGSATSSAGSSRATSPGVTDNESVATNETEETPDDPQAESLMESRAGEENETCLFEGRSKALMFVNEEMAQGTKLTPNDWNSMGVGQIRVLKHKDTGKTRVVFRTEPNANILINSHLVKGVTYEDTQSTKSGAVRGALIYKGSLVRWVFKVKTPEMATQLAKSMEENKDVGS